MMTQGIRGPEVCKLVGITYRQLDYWARTGLVRPSISQAHGSGTNRGYSEEDVRHLKLVKCLLDSGVSLPAARKVIDHIEEASLEAGALVAIVNHDVRPILSTEDITQALRESPLIHLLRYE